MNRFSDHLSEMHRVRTSLLDSSPSVRVFAMSSESVEVLLRCDALHRKRADSQRRQKKERLQIFESAGHLEM